MRRKNAIKNHILIWFVFFGTDFLFSYAIRSGNLYSIPPYIFNVFFSTAYFYVCVYLVILPFIAKSVTQTIIYVILLIGLFCLFKFSWESFFQTDYFVRVVVNEGKLVAYFSYEVWRLTTMTFYSFAYWYYSKSIREEKLRRITEEKLLKSEIDFLKAQINPHFLFNTLNFVYNDVAGISSKSGEAIMSLTRLMRYSVESTKSEYSTLGKELEIIEEYINLQKIRFGDAVFVNYTRTGGGHFFSFPPLVLVSMVENSFKYGIHNDSSDPIDINVIVTSNGLNFRCRNKIRKDFIDKETTTVGHTNVKRRLKMAYGDNYSLETKEVGEHFEVFLNIIWKIS